MLSASSAGATACQEVDALFESQKMVAKRSLQKEFPMTHEEGEDAPDINES